MGAEFMALKEMGTISATATELAAVNALICEETGPGDFQAQYQDLLSDVLNTYRLILSSLTPLTAMTDRAAFKEGLALMVAEFSTSLPVTTNEARNNAEFTYEKNLQFRKRAEVKTSYPILKNAFSRLHDYIDKWIDNDIWLVMSLDNLLKRLLRHLEDVQAMQGKDNEMAYAMYLSCAGQLAPYVSLIQTSLARIEADLPAMSAGSTDAAQSA